MAATAVALQLRSKHRAIRNPSAIHFFSSSSISDSNAENQNTTSSSSSPPPPSQSQTSISSYFSDVKASLKKQAPPQQRQPPKPFYPSSAQTPTSKVASFEEIRKNLSEFRRRSAVPPPEGKPLSQHISLEELYKRNVMSKAEDFANEAGKGGRLSFEAIRESLSQLRSNATKNQVVNNNPMSLSKFKESFKLGPVDPNARDSRVVIGGTERVPASVFEKEKRGAESPAMKTEFVKMYNYKELGTKLRKLRPEAKGENWFLLEELNERLMKLREMEVKETESRIVGDSFKDLRDSLIKLQISDNEKTKKQTNNMSSSEKLKLELQKVRDEFKMSESDCGSSRVQVAQLTTKIKHLSTALHKKDKHSRKGLQGMVQRRKKLLKYLRRTDWDSYCLVLSKLGLRDNPDYKN
ncbi:S15/NS1, RNA-binding protein [Actinidia rufa]|uniref:Small ribosomal subunit protein uS15c n=1 Tax=Actinidia rufa TaxID=165716 RepID=A0A7J0FZB5_9ERIC|nr:S15/NS1, RNA-binding protein [Actinidia rufa]